MTLEDFVILIRNENGWDVSHKLEFEVKRCMDILEDLKKHKETCLIAFCYCHGVDL